VKPLEGAGGADGLNLTTEDVVGAVRSYRAEFERRRDECKRLEAMVAEGERRLHEPGPVPLWRRQQKLRKARLKLEPLARHVGELEAVIADLDRIIDAAESEQRQKRN
jgi:hypothetical protein